MKSIFIIIPISFILFGCQDEMDNDQIFKQQLYFDIDNGEFNTQTYIETSDAHSGTKISRADSGNNFGFGYKYVVPDSLTGKNLFVDVNAWVRTGDIKNNCDIILAVYSNGNNLSWENCNMKEIIKEPNVWTNLTHTFHIPSSVTSNGKIIINVMAHNVTAISYFDVDDLTLSFYEATNN